eukprot:c24047_g1_i1 orf=239-940(-)
MPTLSASLSARLCVHPGIHKWRMEAHYLPQPNTSPRISCHAPSPLRHTLLPSSAASFCAFKSSYVKLSPRAVAKERIFEDGLCAGEEEGRCICESTRPSRGEIQMLCRTALSFALTSAAFAFAFSSFANLDVAQAANPPIRDQVSLDSDLRALALGPQHPLVEEFWDNMRRYGLYFLTVLTGGLYSLLQPILDLFSNPLTAILITIVIVGAFYLLYLTVSTMLGLASFEYKYS